MNARAVANGSNPSQAIAVYFALTAQCRARLFSKISPVVREAAPAGAVNNIASAKT